jgi:arylsulfatase A-like enzyme
MTRPNVVFVITDDQGYGDLGCHGNEVIRTPNVDRLHSEAVRLTDFHVGPTCAPARAGLMTGRYCNCTGVWHTIGGRSLLRRDETTIADVLRAAGYRTGMFGKWHLGDNYPFRPHDRGFEEALYHRGGGVSQAPDHWRNDYFDDTYFRNGSPERCEGYCTDVWFREGTRFIERCAEKNDDRPFFCYISTNAPHGPLNVPERYVEPYAGKVPEFRARFYAMIECIDENVGRLRARLDELGLTRDTIFIFMTDNGTASGCDLDARGFVTGGYNAGMRGEKGWEYDGGHRVPFIMHWPGGGLTAGRDVSRLTAHVDILPTLAELCGASDKLPEGVHGKSIAALLRDPDAQWPERVIVTDSQRVEHPVKWRKSATMSERWRLVNGTELYDIKVDPGQRTDVAAGHPDTVSELRARYEEWWALVSERFDEEIPIVVGSDEEPVTCLSSHDWHNEDSNCPWNQGQIRKGMVATGHWAIDVAEAGEYRVELRRWPREAGWTLTDGPGDEPPLPEGVAEKSLGWYVGGTALALKVAHFTVAGREMSSDVDPAAPGAVFRVDLRDGRATLEAWFEDDMGTRIGAYYVYVERAGGKT